MAQQVLQGFNYGVPITPSDTLDSPQKNNRPPDAYWVGGAGVVVCVLDDGSLLDHTVVAGTYLPFRCKRINATNTTATLIRGWWQL